MTLSFRCTTRYYSRTTLYYKVLLQHYSVLQSSTPVLLCTTKALLQYHSVLQSTTPVLLCTTSTSLCHKSTNPSCSVLQMTAPAPLQHRSSATLYHKVLLRATKHYCVLKSLTWNVTDIARSNRRHCPTSPNIAPATQNDSHAWFSSHMKCQLQCAEQQASLSSLAKYCACHAKWLACLTLVIYNARSSACHAKRLSSLLIPVTHETAFTVRGATDVILQPHQIRKVTLQHHQIVRLPRKVTIPINSLYYYLTIPIAWWLLLLDSTITWRYLLLDNSYFLTLLLLDDSYYLTIPFTGLYTVTRLCGVVRISEVSQPKLPLTTYSKYIHNKFSCHCQSLLCVHILIYKYIWSGVYCTYLNMWVIFVNIV